VNPLLYFLIFLKASLFSTGGLGNLPSLHQDLLGSGWATETDFGKAVAVGQITPGPNGLWVIALGYITFGWLGALLALIAIVLPPFIVLLVAAGYQKIEHYPAVRGLLRGLSLAVVGSLLATSCALISAPGIDWRGWVVALVTVLVGLTNRVHVIFILVGAGAAGYIFFQ
jgi:chromate transporter